MQRHSLTFELHKANKEIKLKKK